MSLTLTKIPPFRLPDFRPELDAILARCPRGYTLDWILRKIDEDALHPLAIVNGSRRAGLVLVSVDDSGPRRALNLFGVAAMPRGSIARDGAAASHRERGSNSSASTLGALQAPLRALARHLGCAVIQGVSSRRGWARRAKPVATIYEVEI